VWLNANDGSFLVKKEKNNFDKIGNQYKMSKKLNESLQRERYNAKTTEII